MQGMAWKMKNYQDKQYYLLKHQGRELASKYTCPACKKLMYNFHMSMQHRLHNSKQNRKLYPLFIDSLLNLSVIHLKCNVTTHRSYGQITPYNAKRYESFLQSHPKIAEWVNNPDG